MIDPQHFGCSAKLAFSENNQLSNLAGNYGFDCRDFSRLKSHPLMIQSIDKISRCSLDWDKFATVAIIHALNDIVAGGAVPEQVLISFEFGPDADLESDRMAASVAFLEVASKLGIAVGKCHSSIGYGPTSVTISSIGSQKEAVAPAIGENGTLVLSNSIGAFKIHYLKELGTISDDYGAFKTLQNRLSEIGTISNCSVTVTDVTGHSLLGQVLTLAKCYELDIELELSRRHMFHADVLDIPVDCLQNRLEEYAGNVCVENELALNLALVKETAGPFLGLQNSNVLLGDESMTIGKFKTGIGKVSLAWAD